MISKIKLNVKKSAKITFKSCCSLNCHPTGLCHSAQLIWSTAKLRHSAHLASSRAKATGKTLAKAAEEVKRRHVQELAKILEEAEIDLVEFDKAYLLQLEKDANDAYLVGKEKKKKFKFYGIGKKKSSKKSSKKSKSRLIGSQAVDGSQGGALNGVQAKSNGESSGIEAVQSESAQVVCDGESASQVTQGAARTQVSSKGKSPVIQAASKVEDSGSSTQVTSNGEDSDSQGDSSTRATSIAESGYKATQGETVQGESSKSSIKSESSKSSVKAESSGSKTELSTQASSNGSHQTGETSSEANKRVSSEPRHRYESFSTLLAPNEPKRWSPFQKLKNFFTKSKKEPTAAIPAINLITSATIASTVTCTTTVSEKDAQRLKERAQTNKNVKMHVANWTEQDFCKNNKIATALDFVTAQRSIRKHDPSGAPIVIKDDGGNIITIGANLKDSFNIAQGGQSSASGEPVIEKPVVQGLAAGHVIENSVSQKDTATAQEPVAQNSLANEPVSKETTAGQQSSLSTAIGSAPKEYPKKKLSENSLRVISWEGIKKTNPYATTISTVSDTEDASEAKVHGTRSEIRKLGELAAVTQLAISHLEAIEPTVTTVEPTTVCARKLIVAAQESTSVAPPQRPKRQVKSLSREGSVRTIVAKYEKQLSPQSTREENKPVLTSDEEDMLVATATATILKRQDARKVEVKAVKPATDAMDDSAIFSNEEDDKSGSDSAVHDTTGSVVTEEDGIEDMIEKDGAPTQEDALIAEVDTEDVSLNDAIARAKAQEQEFVALREMVENVLEYDAIAETVANQYAIEVVLQDEAVATQKSVEDVLEDDAIAEAKTQDLTTTAATPRSRVLKNPYRPFHFCKNKFKARRFLTVETATAIASCFFATEYGISLTINKKPTPFRTATEAFAAQRGRLRNVVEQVVGSDVVECGELLDTPDHSVSGAQGCVRVVKLGGSTYAAKRVIYPSIQNRRFLIRECALLRQKHPNMLRCHGVFLGRTSLTFLLERLKFTLNDVLYARRRFAVSEACAVRITLDIANALRFLHERLGYMHSDIKRDNIMVSNQGVVKLIDFGLVLPINRTVNTRIGTAETMAPEVVKRERFNEKADIWSLGITLRHMVEFHTVRIEKLAHVPPAKLMDNIRSLRSIPRMKSPEISPLFKKLINRTLHLHPSFRPSASELFHETSAYVNSGQLQIASGKEMLKIIDFKNIHIVPNHINQ